MTKVNIPKRETRYSLRVIDFKHSVDGNIRVTDGNERKTGSKLNNNH